MLWDFVLWDFVLWDFVRRDFVLWDSVPDSAHHNLYQKSLIDRRTLLLPPTLLDVFPDGCRCVVSSLQGRGSLKV